VPFPDKRDHRITREQARQMCRNYRDGERRGGPLRAGAFPRAVLDQILAQAGCEGVRIYLAQNDAGETTLVALGTDADGRDMDQGLIVDDVFPCPPFCGGGTGLEE
jgi:hypothetical protein